MRWARRSWTVLAVALQQEKRLQSILRHGRTDRRQRSLQLREDALSLGHRYDQRSDDQHSAVGRRLETWHCYNYCWVSLSAARYSSSRCPLLTPENILAVKISWTIRGGAGRPASKYANTRFDLSPEWISFCHSLQCWPKNQKCCKQWVLRAYNTANCNCSRGSAPNPAGVRGCTALPQIL